MKLPKQVVAALLARFANSPLPLREILIMSQIIFEHQAVCFYDSCLNSGTPLTHTDPIGMKQWLEELAAAAQVDIWPGTEVFSPKITPIGNFCPDCGHVHLDDAECQFPIGGARTCRCERKVSA